MKAIMILLLAATAWQVSAQKMEGRIHTGQKFLPDATVQIFQGGILKGIRSSGPEGVYSFNTLDVGLYDVLFTYPGCDSVLVKDVVVIPERTTDQGAKLTRSSWQTKCITLQYALLDIVTSPTYISQTNRIEPLQMGVGHQSGTVYIVDAVICPMQTVTEFNPSEPGRYVFNRQDIERMPTMSLNDIISMVPGTYQRRRGDVVQFYGGRTDGNVYYVDGMRQ